MCVEYKNIYINLNSKLNKVSSTKYKNKLIELKESIANSEGYAKELLIYRLEVLESQYSDFRNSENLGGLDFKKYRRINIGDIFSDRFYDLILEDVIESRHPSMYKIDLTMNLPLVLAYTFNLDYKDTRDKLKIICDEHNISVEYLSTSILSQSKNEVLNCDVELGVLWDYFPELKRFLSELCKLSNESDKCIIDCVSSSSYNSCLGISINDDERQLLTALSLKLILGAQNIIKDCILQIDELKKNSGVLSQIYSQYICGCIFGVHGECPKYFLVRNTDNRDFIITVDNF